MHLVLFQIKSAFNGLTTMADGTKREEIGEWSSFSLEVQR